jgi:glycosyltransferase involved in cell wall biosynthesis
MKRAVRAVTVAPLTWRYGHEYTLEAIALLREREQAVEYVLVGEGPNLRAVFLARHQLGLSDCVRILAKPPWRGLTPLLSRADIYLCAAVAPVDHPIPGAVLRRGIPAVCADVAAGSVPATAKGRLSIVPRWDANAIAQAVESLMSTGGSSSTLNRPDGVLANGQMRQ